MRQKKVNGRFTQANRGLFLSGVGFLLPERHLRKERRGFACFQLSEGRRQRDGRNRFNRLRIR